MVQPNAVHRVHWIVKDYRVRIQKVGNVNVKTVLSIRDPRDTVVSYYYKVVLERETITTSNMPLLDYVKGNFLRVTPPAHGIAAAEPVCSWADFYREWRDEGVDAEMRHEDMLADPEAQLVRLADQLNLPIVGDISSILREYPDKMRAPYTREYTEGQLLEATVPRGQSRWTERLGGTEAALIRRFCGDIMETYGYE